MKPFQVVGANRADVRMPIELPFDAEGRWAVDEAGKPVRGRKPVMIELPRFEFIDAPVHKAMIADIEAVSKSEDLTDQERTRQIHLVSLKPFVDEQVFTLLAQRAIGEIEQVSQYWQEQSAISLGEYLASKGSSTSTRRPSSSTSSTVDSDSETSVSA